LKKEESNRGKQLKSLQAEIEKLKEEISKPPPADLLTEDQVKDMLVCFYFI